VRHDAPVAEHRLDARHLGAHRAVANDMDPPGVGGDHAADRARVAGRQVHAEGQPGRSGVGLQPGQRDAGSGGDLCSGGVDLTELIETAEAQHHLPVQWHAAADEARVATLRHDRDAGPPAGPHDGRHLLRGTGSDHSRGRAPEPAGPVDGVARGQLGVEQDV
jgi:hypothetical protein